jgi:hypothetical protein
MALLSVRSLLSRAAAGAVTHADLFFENPVKLPFLNIRRPVSIGLGKTTHC